MIASGIPIYQFSVPKSCNIYGNFNSYKLNSRWRQKWTEIRCCKQKVGEKARTKKNYYELLGVSADSNLQEIKEAYRKLQKKYHPDIAGQEGHEYTLMLNEAYEVLIKDDLRRNYDASMGPMRGKFGKTLSGYSSWKGPLRPHALFVDANACIGCRECVHHASNTFVMDEALGCARVRVQFGDDDQKIDVSVESCPVNCIHWVDREELAVLEFLVQPQLKEGYGVFGGGWERPANVFMAAKTLSKQLKEQAEAESRQRNGRVKVEEETPAQAEARANASMKIQMERFGRMWNNLKPLFGSNIWDQK
ncbi:hypothetical protein CCACVL1_24977 [Corchorus capsularis]|uniref:J domain-containing protein n=1 Tax=Corchorus capsularis TaxID=210143 RepID=A0A1R3GMD6_COCAP|nr:hypothetical protein CCACVL1_24977 [Corchorus capsularis]